VKIEILEQAGKCREIDNHQDLSRFSCSGFDVIDSAL
jgi:hypothetical protein